MSKKSTKISVWFIETLTLLILWQEKQRGELFKCPKQFKVARIYFECYLTNETRTP